jgi:hypothetical protein
MLLDLFWLLVGRAERGGGGRKKRKYFAKQEIYGHVVEAYRKVFEKEIAPEVVEEVVETVAVKLEVEVAVPERDIEAEISVLETKALIMSIMLKMQEEEDEETALFSMM